MFCCGTNVVFRRRALEAVGGFPEGSVTEDFELSIELHELGWTSAYVPTVLASGLGPEDLASYVSQQHRWARGCVGALGRVARSSLPWRLKLQYVLSASYFLTGWTVLLYMCLPVVRILTGDQPVAGADADQFFTHFAPYFGLALLMVAVAGDLVPSDLRPSTAGLITPTWTKRACFCGQSKRNMARNYLGRI